MILNPVTERVGRAQMFDILIMPSDVNTVPAVFQIRHYKDNDAILDAGQYDVTQLRAVLME